MLPESNIVWWWNKQTPGVWAHSGAVAEQKDQDGSGHNGNGPGSDRMSFSVCNCPAAVSQRCGRAGRVADEGESRYDVTSNAVGAADRSSASRNDCRITCAAS